MDGRRFDELTRGLAVGISRRTVNKGLVGGVVVGVAALLGRSGADARRVTQAYCGNMTCIDDPSVCADGCVCCDFGNGNSRCMPPRTCERHGGEIECPPGEVYCDGECIAAQCCSGQPNGGSCASNEDCCSGICQANECVATVAGTCEAGADTCVDGPTSCGGGECQCYQSIQGDTVCGDTVTCVDTCDDCESEGQGWICGVKGDLCCSDSTQLCIHPCQPNVCFTGATRITLADGTSKPIEQVAVGDRVIGQTGINTVLAVLTPRLGSRRLYALNGSDFFVTAAHPFLTEDGWKAIDPAATVVEHAGLHVGRLVVGDRLLALAGVATPALALAGETGRGEEAVTTHLQAVPLRSIIGIPGDPATPLYNLRVDGDHTYLANNLVVHNKR